MQRVFEKITICTSACINWKKKLCTKFTNEINASLTDIDLEICANVVIWTLAHLLLDTTGYFKFDAVTFVNSLSALDAIFDIAVDVFDVSCDLTVW